MDDVTPDLPAEVDGFRPDRRKLLIAGAATGAAAWIAPSIRSVASAQAATAAPGPAPGMAAWFAADIATGPGAVLTWPDQSGNVNDADAPGPLQAPTFVASAINGLPALDFDGSDDVLEVPFTLDPTVPGFEYATVFAVFQSDTDAFELRKVYSNDAGSYDRVAGLDNRGGTTYIYFSESPDVGDYFDPTTGTPYLTVDQWTPTTFTGTVNGTELVGAQPVNGNNGAPSTFIGALNAGGAEPWDGLIAEVIIYVGAAPLTAPEIAQTQQYLLDKYGLP